MNLLRVTYKVLLFTLLLLTCAPLQDPTTIPTNATFRTRSLASLKDTIPAFTPQKCTVSIVLPHLLDSVKIKLLWEQTEQVLFKQSKPVDSVIIFNLELQKKGPYYLQGYAYQMGGTVDTLPERKIFVNKFSPSIVAQPSRVSVHIGGTGKAIFTITDIDKDLKRVFFDIDSFGSTFSATPFQMLNDTVFKVSIPHIIAKYDTVVIFTQAEDSTGLLSTFGLCTLAVYDTTKPTVKFGRLSPSKGDTILTLPCTLSVYVKDKAPIDTIDFFTSPFVIRNDTAYFAISQADSGLNSHQLLVIDRGKNKSALTITYYYKGAKVYPPVITSKLIGQQILENQSFKKIKLDTCISIDTNLVSYRLNNIKWTVVEEDPIGKISAKIDSSLREISFSVPDSEWNGSEAFTVIASAPGNLTSAKPITMSVLPVNDIPKIKKLSHCKMPYLAFDTIAVDTCANDPDNKIGTLIWSADTSKSKYITLRGGYGISPIEPRLPPIGMRKANSGIWNRRWVPQIKVGAVLPIDSLVRDSIRVTVFDGKDSSSTYFFFNYKKSCGLESK